MKIQDINDINIADLFYLGTFDRSMSERIISIHYFKYKIFLIKIRIELYCKKYTIDEIVFYNNKNEVLYLFTNYDTGYGEYIMNKEIFFRLPLIEKFTHNILESYKKDNYAIFFNFKTNAGIIRCDSTIFKKYQNLLRKEKIQKILDS